MFYSFEFNPLSDLRSGFKLKYYHLLFGQKFAFPLFWGISSKFVPSFLFVSEATWKLKTSVTLPNSTSRRRNPFWETNARRTCTTCRSTWRNRATTFRATGPTAQVATSSSKERATVSSWWRWWSCSRLSIKSSAPTRFLLLALCLFMLIGCSILHGLQTSLWVSSKGSRPDKMMAL